MKISDKDKGVFEEYARKWVRNIFSKDFDEKKSFNLVQDIYKLSNLTLPKESFVASSPKEALEIVNKLTQKSYSLQELVNNMCNPYADYFTLSTYDFMWNHLKIKEYEKVVCFTDIAKICGNFICCEEFVVFVVRPIHIYLKHFATNKILCSEKDVDDDLIIKSTDRLILHKDGNSALKYKGYQTYYLNGVEVPKWLACEPSGKIQPEKIKDIKNVEVRREFIRKIGIDRIRYKLGSKVLDKLDTYELHEIDFGDGLKRKYLLMSNPSLDDTWHLEGIINECKTVQEALNFRNGLTPNMIDDENGVDWYQQGDVILRPKGAKKYKSRPIIIT